LIKASKKYAQGTLIKKIVLIMFIDNLRILEQYACIYLYKYISITYENYPLTQSVHQHHIICIMCTHVSYGMKYLPGFTHFHTSISVFFLLSVSGN